MISLEDAWQQLETNLPFLGEESVEVAQAHGRILAQPVRALAPLPSFDNSAMDGYAVLADDVQSASRDRPVRLCVLGEIPAGSRRETPLKSGTCWRIYTGSPMPPGANAVVMQEDTRPLPDHDTPTIEVFEAAKPWDHVRFQGEDIQEDQLLLETGQRMNASAIAVCHALGVAHIRAGRKPAVGIVASGSELQIPGSPLMPGKIYESNRSMLAQLVSQAGGLPQIHRLLPDSLDDTVNALRQALESTDALITSGGVSVGDYDLLKQAFQTLGGTVAFWKISIRPGKPFVFGQWKGKSWFGLPGNPVSALVTFLMLARPALLHMQGALTTSLPSLPGRLREPFVNRGDRRHFVRVRLDAQGEVHIAGQQGSHMIGSMIRSNGLVDVPPETALPAGTPVKVLLWDV